jgi:hypothetical protein
LELPKVDEERGYLTSKVAKCHNNQQPPPKPIPLGQVDYIDQMPLQKGKKVSKTINAYFDISQS